MAVLLVVYLAVAGIRAGASNSDKTTRAAIDYLAALRENGSLDATVGPTVAALAEPFRKAYFDTACARIGGGFSAVANPARSRCLAVALAVAAAPRLAWCTGGGGPASIALDIHLEDR